MRIRQLMLFVLALVPFAAVAQQFEYGVATNLKRYSQPLDFYAEKMRSAGITSFRSAISWQYVEKQKGVYAIPKEYEGVAAQFDNAPKNGMRPIFILGYGNPLYDRSGLVTTPESREAFANYAKWIASRFKGKVKYYEIWNEWFTGARQFGDKSVEATIPDYVKLVQVAAAAIKSVDPAAIVLGGGADGSKNWFEQFAAQGGLDHIDGLSIHPYNFTQFYKDGFTPEASLATMQKLHDEFVRAYGKNVPFYVTEIGWPTSQARYSEQAQAAFVERYFILARAASFVRGVWWYELSDGGADAASNEDNFGLLDHQGQPKASFRTFGDVVKLLKTHSTVAVRNEGQDMSAVLRGSGDTRSLRWVYKGIPSDAFLKSGATKAAGSSASSEFTPKTESAPVN